MGSVEVIKQSITKFRNYGNRCSVSRLVRKNWFHL